jgi:uncharacterized protein with beta-barrel porin domain
MTKNKFLSKRLACLLTTALVSMPITLNKSFAQLSITGSASRTAGYDATITFDGLADHFLNITPASADAVFTGAVTTAVTDLGSLSFGGRAGLAPFTSTFNAAVGTSAKTLNFIVIGTTSLGGAATFDSNVFAKTIQLVAGDASAEVANGTFAGNVTGAMTLNDLTGFASANYTGTSDQTITGAINGASAGEGEIVVNNTTGKTVTFASAIGTTQVRVVNVNGFKTAVFNDVVKSTQVNVLVDATATFKGIITTPTLNVLGTANINVKNQAVAVTTLQDIGKIVINKAIVSGETVFASTNQTNATINAAGKIYYPANLKNGETLVLFNDSSADDTGTATAVAATTVSQNNALSTYTAALSTQQIVVTAADKSAATTASELGVNTNKATGLLQARNAAAAANTAGTDTAAIDAIFNVLNAQSGQSATADTAFTNQVAPQTDTIAGSTVAAKAVTSGVQNVISTRLASLRSGDAYSTGVVTGSGMSANSGFMQAFGSIVEQKNKGNEFGYDADTKGFAIGFDGKIDGGAVIGISYAHSDADVDGKGTSKAKNDIKTDSISLYADYATKDGYVEGSITYGKSDNKGSRVIDTGGLSRTYTSNYDSEQSSFRLFGGIPQSLGSGAFFTPFAGATISQIKADAYTETSTTANDSLRLRVAQDTVNSQVGTIGIKYHQAIKDGKTTFTPEVKLALNNEFGDGNITTTNTYQGGGTSFKNSTAIERTSATAGVGLNISSDNVSFNIGYEADVRDKYLGHSAQAKITAKF